MQVIRKTYNELNAFILKKRLWIFMADLFLTSDKIERSNNALILLSRL